MAEKKPISLSDIFTDDVKFIIPDYQRGYSWGKEQLDDLWEDLENMTLNGHHYTGMFTFCQRQATDGSSIRDIVDGQQRMTTLLILINELLKKIDIPIDPRYKKEHFISKYLYTQSEDNPYLWWRKFEYADSSSDTFFVTKILGLKDSREGLHTETLYTNNLLVAKKYFSEEKLPNLNQQQLVELFEKVTKRLVFNEYLIDDINEVYVTFETMNNRGKSLSTLELLKNRLIYLTTITPVEKLREDIDNTWKTIYKYLGKSVKNKLDDDDFLRDHWIMYFKYDRSKSKVYKNTLLSDKFTARRSLNGDLKPDEMYKYVVSLKESIKDWFNISCPLESDCEDMSEMEKMWLTRINREGGIMFRPLLMAIYSKPERTNIEDLLKACERYRFLVYHISQRRSNTGDSFFYNLAHEYFVAKDNTLTIAQIVDKINEKTKDLYSKKGFIYYIVERYRHHNDGGFFSWSGIRYFLYEYEKSLQDKTKDKDDKADWNKIFEKNQDKKDSIEHIFPQTPQDLYWTQRFPDEKAQALTHSLGNLLLISRPHNSELQNYPFTTPDESQKSKKEIYKKGSYSEIDVAQKNEWTPTEIINRGKELLKFLVNHWDIDTDLEVFTDDDINKLLNVIPDTSTTPPLELSDKNYDGDYYYDDPDFENE